MSEVNLSCDADVKRGREAWDRLQHSARATWEDWIMVGLALDRGRSEAGWSAGTNCHKGRAFNEEFSKWLKAHGFDGIDKGTRSRLSQCLEHKTEIEAWRATLSLAELTQTNHPNTVWRKWKASSGDKPRAPRTSLKDEKLRLERELSRMKANGGERFTAKDTAKDIANTIVAMLPDHKLNQVIDLLIELRSAKKPKKAAKQMKAEPRAE